MSPAVSGCYPDVALELVRVIRSKLAAADVNHDYVGSSAIWIGGFPLLLMLTLNTHLIAVCNLAMASNVALVPPNALNC